MIHFAPKYVPFLSSNEVSVSEEVLIYYNHCHPNCFVCRLQLATLHINENSGQAVRCDGTKRFDIIFPKFKRGGYIVLKIKTEATYCIL